MRVFGSHQLENFKLMIEELKVNANVNPGMRSSCLQEVMEANQAANGTLMRARAGALSQIRCVFQSPGYPFG